MKGNTGEVETFTKKVYVGRWGKEGSYTYARLGSESGMGRRIDADANILRGDQVDHPNELHGRFGGHGEGMQAIELEITTTVKINGPVRKSKASEYWD